MSQDEKIMLETASWNDLEELAKEDSGAVVEANRRVIKSIEKLDESSGKVARVNLALTIVMAVFTVIQVVLAIWSASR